MFEFNRSEGRKSLHQPKGITEYRNGGGDSRSDENGYDHINRSQRIDFRLPNSEVVFVPVDQQYYNYGM